MPDEDAADGTGTLARARAEELPLDTLTLIVEHVHPGASVIDVEPLPGGLGSVMDIVRLADAPVSSLVLRRLLPEWGDDDASLRAEVLTHRLLRKLGLPVPRVAWSDGVGRAFGRPAMLMDFVGGHPMCVDLAGPGAAVDELARAAVALHAIPADRACHLDRLRTAADYRDRYGPRPARSDVVDAAALVATLASPPPLADPDACMVHGDLHGGNVLWNDTMVTGILDWTGAATGARWWDVGYLWMDTSLMYGPEAGEALVAAYLAAGGADVPPAEWWYWRGMALARALPSPGMWLSAYHGTGVTHLTTDLLDERYTALVTTHLEGAP